jgi:hypothetical protein
METKWIGHRNGNFANAVRWTDGVPNASTDALIGAAGTPYNIALNTTATAHSLTIDSSDVTLTEAQRGQLAITGFVRIRSGHLSVTGSHNSFGGVLVDGGWLTVQNSHALGAATVNLSDGGTLDTSSTVSLGNTLDVKGNANIGATGTGALNVTGDVRFDSHDPGTITFEGGGHVLWDPASVNRYSDNIVVTGGTTVVAGAGNSLGSGTVTLNNGALAFSNPNDTPHVTEHEQNTTLKLQGTAVIAPGDYRDLELAAVIIAGGASVLFEGADAIVIPTEKPPSGAPATQSQSLDEPAHRAALVADFSSFTAQGSYTLGIQGTCTLESNIANETAFDSLLSQAATVTLGSGAILDLTGQDGVTLNRLSGMGEIVNRGAREDLTIAITQAPGFAGRIEGDFNLTTSTVATFSGSVFDLKAGDTIHMGGSFGLLDLGGVHFVKCITPDIDMGAGTNNDLGVDHDFLGTILNLASGDSFIIEDETYAAGGRLRFVQNADHSGGNLEVKIGDQHWIDLALTGHFHSSDFFISNTAGNQPFIEYSPAGETPPHAHAVSYDHGAILI